MMKPSIALRLLATACLLATVVIAGGAMAKSVETAKSSATPLVALAQAPAAQQDVAATVNLGPACARKVKVVYTGYGEGDRASCTTPAKVAAD